MTDIVERLRFINTKDAQEAAAEIERLRAERQDYKLLAEDLGKRLDLSQDEIERLRGEVEQLQSKLDWLGYKDPSVS